MVSRPIRLTRWAARLVAVIVLAGLLFVAWDQATYNFGAVQRGRVYRSGQMPASALSRTIREYRIKTVLNLRGPNKDRWYLDERAATLAAGATQIDIPMSSCIWMSHAQLRTVIETLDTADYPLLIHCQWGSERTGLVAAFAELLRPRSTLDDGRAQFSIRHLFVPISDGKIMAEHLEQYAGWLRNHGLEHDPANLRRWANEGFQPQVPNREQWPYDPYPLVVVTRPPLATAPGPAARGPGPVRR
jgi:protein-tyrosine phosphatase